MQGGQEREGTLSYLKKEHNDTLHSCTLLQRPQSVFIITGITPHQKSPEGRAGQGWAGQSRAGMGWAGPGL